MAHVISHETTIQVITCYKCGTPIALDDNLYRRLQDDGDTFWCPLGHGQVFSQTREQKIKELEKKLKAEAELRKVAQQNEKWWQDEANQVQTELKTTRRQLTTTKATLTRTKNRVSKGICPCCNRQFVNLHRHMANQHPEYSGEQEAI